MMIPLVDQPTFFFRCHRTAVAGYSDQNFSEFASQISTIASGTRVKRALRTPIAATASHQLMMQAGA